MCTTYCVYCIPIYVKVACVVCFRARRRVLVYDFVFVCLRDWALILPTALGLSFDYSLPFIDHCLHFFFVCPCEGPFSWFSHPPCSCVCLFVCVCMCVFVCVYVCFSTLTLIHILAPAPVLISLSPNLTPSHIHLHSLHSGIYRFIVTKSDSQS